MNYLFIIVCICLLQWLIVLLISQIGIETSNKNLSLFITGRDTDHKLSVCSIYRIDKAADKYLCL